MELTIQTYLRSGKTLVDLYVELGINVYRHMTLPLVGLKYSQINSPKTNPIVRDCRGIVLEDQTWEIVAKPFRRFFNAGEDAETFQKFNWKNFTTTTKHDGSLILLYFYAEEWRVNTSGSFGDGIVGFSGKTWSELFWETSGIDTRKLHKALTYIFELWTPANKVIRVYPKPTAFLLSIFEKNPPLELHPEQVEREAKAIGAIPPEFHPHKSMDDIANFLREKEATDKTFEGVVIRDNTGERYKVKSQTYLALHHLFDNGNLFNPKRLVPLVLAGETDEVLAYLPELKPEIEKVHGEISREWDKLKMVWHEHRDIESQKDFAISILPKTPFSSLLFSVRKLKGKYQTEKDLQKMWQESSELIVKNLYK